MNEILISSDPDYKIKVPSEELLNLFEKDYSILKINDKTI